MPFCQKLLIAGLLLLAPFTTTACQNLPFPTIQTIRNPKDYIGFQYENPQKLKDLEFLGGSVFGSGAVKNMEGGYTYLRQNGKNMLWLTGQKKPDSEGKQISEVLDVLIFPEYDKQLNKGTYYLSRGRCRINGKSTSDAEVVAIVVSEREELLANVKQAWRIDRKTGNFKSIPNDNIVCENTNLS